MFDDDDDVELQLKAVDNYYFVESGDDGDDPVVCFSLLPLKFDENDKVSEKRVYLHRYTVDSHPAVYEKVVAWTVALDCEQPKISVLSSESYWIELLKPWKPYGKFARSVLTTVQMLHFVRGRPRAQMRSLCVHLCEVFIKFDTEPVEDDLRKNHCVIKQCAERDPTLMKSKILRSFIEDISGNNVESILRSLGKKEAFIVDAESLASGDDIDKGDGDTGSDGNTIGDDRDGIESICAICDGGELLSCKGKCKRAFHPTLEAGRRSKCETLGYTFVQEMGKYVCKNYTYEQHQCFKCGQLEPSDESNAKVFQCCKVYCGHFYHPKCAAELLEPHSNGACELENKIAAGMPFTCPVHWCSKSECGKMEDRTQRAMWLAGYRRCPRSYHKDCLPSEISFEKYCAKSIRTWFLSERNLSKRIIIYCTDHDIDTVIGTPCRDHIKLPTIPEIDGTRDLAKKKNNDECAELSSKLSREGDQTQRVATNNSMEHIALKPGCGATRLKKDLQFEPSVVGAADAALSSLEAIKGKRNQLGSSRAVDNETENRLTSMAAKETFQDIARKCVMPSTSAYSTKHIGKIKSGGIFQHSKVLKI